MAAGIVQLHSSESPVGPRALPPLVWWFSFPCLWRQVMRGWSPLPVSSDLRWEKEGGMARAATVPPIRKSDALPKALGRRLLLSHWPEWCHVTTPSCKGGQEGGTLLSQPLWWRKTRETAWKWVWGESVHGGCCTPGSGRQGRVVPTVRSSLHCLSPC